MTNIQGLVTFLSLWLDRGMKAMDWRNGSFGSQLKVQLSWWSQCSRNLRLVPWHQQFRHRGQLSWSHFCAVIKCPGAKQLQGERELILVVVLPQSVTVGKSAQKLEEFSHVQNREQREWTHTCLLLSLLSLLLHNSEPIPKKCCPHF